MKDVLTSSGINGRLQLNRWIDYKKGWIDHALSLRFSQRQREHFNDRGRNGLNEIKANTGSCSKVKDEKKICSPNNSIQNGLPREAQAGRSAISLTVPQP